MGDARCQGGVGEGLPSCSSSGFSCQQPGWGEQHERKRQLKSYVMELQGT